MPEKPYISQGANTGDDLYAMGAFPLGIGTFNPTDIINPGDTGLFAGFEPVMEAISTPNPGGVLLEAKTASGAAPLMISDAAKNQILSLLTNIKPVQDLHGYANPWPAGGGANRWDEEWEVGTISAQTGVPSASTTQIRSKNYCSCEPSTSYYCQCIKGRNIMNIFWYEEDYTFISAQGFNTVTASPANAKYFKICGDNAYGTEYLNDIAVNNPSTITTYSPYANICPISGWNGCNVYISPTTNAADATVYPCVWQDEAGTVYGGQIDVATGWLEVTMAEADLGTLVWQNIPAGNHVFTALLIGSKNNTGLGNMPNLLCEQYKTIGAKSVTQWSSTTEDCVVSLGYDTFRIYIRDERYSDYSELSTALSAIKVVYELATPQYYQVHATNIFTLDGVNYIWTDCGDQITVQYAAVK